MFPVLIGLGVLAGVVFADLPAWLLVVPVLLLAAGAALARDRSRSLGHALVDGHLVLRSGSVVRHRVVLETDAVIGWKFRSSYFQRRVGLTTLVATTAGGGQAYAALDIPGDLAVDVAAAAHPGLLQPFLV